MTRHNIRIAAGTQPNIVIPPTAPAAHADSQPGSKRVRTDQHFGGGISNVRLDGHLA